MNFLPIVARELRVAARRRSTFWIRWCSTLGLVGICVFLWATGSRQAAAALSHFEFVSIGAVVLGFCMLSGTFLTADCLSEEKREGTLGLLFLTDLNGADVVLGKLVATSINAVYALLAIFPVLALPLLVGGVTAAEFWRVTLVLLATLFLSLSCGMLSSAIYREARQSMSSAFGAILVLAALFPAAYWLQAVLFKRVFWDAFLLASPPSGFRAALDAYYSGGRMGYWSSLMCIGGLGAGALITSALLLPLMLREKNERLKNNAAKVERLKSSTSSASLRLPVLNTFYWLMIRRRLGLAAAGARSGGWIMPGLLIIWLLFLVASIGGSSNKEAFVGCLFTAYALHVVGKSRMAIESTRQLSADRQSGALELLLVTPLKETQIIADHAKAIREICRPWFAVIAATNALMAVTVLTCPGRLSMRWEDQIIFLELFIGGLLALLIDFSAITTSGPWNALRTGKHSRAILNLLARLFLPSWLAGLMVIFLMNNGVNSEFGARMIFGSWFVVGYLTSASMVTRARRGLAGGFRKVISREKGGQPSGQRPPGWPIPLNA